MSMPNSRCSGMPHGLYPTSAVGNHNQTSNRFPSGMVLFVLLAKVYLNDLVLLFVLEQVKPALSALQRLIHSQDEEVLTDAYWALSYLSDGTNDKIQAVIESGVFPRLVELLM